MDHVSMFMWGCVWIMFLCLCGDVYESCFYVYVGMCMDHVLCLCGDLYGSSLFIE